MAVREDMHGRLVEKAATDFDLRSPLVDPPEAAHASRPTTATAHAMPPRVELAQRRLRGLPVPPRGGRRDRAARTPSYFIFYDDVDFALRARRAGYRIWAVRDAVLVRQLDFSQQHDLAGWKGYYMYRNLFVVHFRYGENALVRAKP